MWCGICGFEEQYGERWQPHQGLVGGTTDEKKQRLWDGNTDIIYADYSSSRRFIQQEGVDAQLGHEAL